MTEVILGLVIILMIGLLAWEKRENKKERLTFINALFAKTPEQFRDLELTAKVKPIEPPVQKEPDLIPESEIEDKKFQELISKEVA